MNLQTSRAITAAAKSDAFDAYKGFSVEEPRRWYNSIEEQRAYKNFIWLWLAYCKKYQPERM